MATKRDIDAVAGADSDELIPHPSTKRARGSGNQRKSKHSQEPQTDLTYGQRSCFPSLDHSVGNSDEDLEFEDDSDALAYLQSVRQQANSIPHLLVAPRSGPQLPPPRRATDGLAYDDDGDDYNGAGEEEAVDRSIYDDGYDDERGYYEDGAYTAAPEKLDSNSFNHNYNDADAEADQDAAADEAARISEAYYNSISAQFSALRHRLHQDPPPAVLAALAGDQSPHVGRFGAGSRTFSVWSARVRGSDPAPAQVAAMDKGAVFRVLRVVLGGKFLRRGAELRERTSRWLWALLARLPGRGELDHMEVGYVRELGKRAALLMHSLREMAELRREVEGGGVGGGGGPEEDDGLEGDEEDWAGEGEAVDDEGDDSAPARKEEAETTTPMDRQERQETPAEASSDHPARSSSTAPTSIPDAKGEAGEEMEDGEVDESAPMDIDDGDVESAKARLLANVAALDAYESGSGKTADREEDPPTFDPVRARMNMRATLNMILTVAGEFYGQRDLLEFRDPFHGL